MVWNSEFLVGFVVRFREETEFLRCWIFDCEEVFSPCVGGLGNNLGERGCEIFWDVRFWGGDVL